MRRTFSNYTSYDIRVSQRRELHPTSMQVYHYHNLYEMYYLLSGERYYFIKDKTYHIKKGDLVLIKEYLTHCSVASESCPYERMLIDFKKDFISDINEAMGGSLFECFNNDIHVISFGQNDRTVVESILNNMLSEYNKKSAGYISYLKSSIAQLLLLANRNKSNYVEYNNEYINSTHKIVAEATGYINNHFSEDINLEFISDKFFVSTYYFSRIFKKSTGLTFIEYLNNVRIKEAQKLLDTTTLSISEISEQVGYKSNTHFGRIFRRIANTSPREYRKIDNK